VALLGSGELDAGNWITIGVSVSAFIGQLVNTWFKEWLERRRAKGELDKPRRPVGRIGSLLGNRLISIILSMISIPFGVIFLVIELSGTDPITRKMIFNITLYMGAIFSHLLLLLTYSHLYLADERDELLIGLLDTHRDLLYKHNESINGLMEMQGKFTSLISDQMDVIEKISIITGIMDSPIEIKKEITDMKENSIC
jgi:hypothetical protein